MDIVVVEYREGVPYTNDAKSLMGIDKDGFRDRMVQVLMLLPFGTKLLVQNDKGDILRHYELR